MKKYLPDILILLGIWIFSYFSLFPFKSNVDQLVEKYGNQINYDYSSYFKLLAIILISIGINIAIRKIINKNNK